MEAPPRAARHANTPGPTVAVGPGVRVGGRGGRRGDESGQAAPISAATAAAKPSTSSSVVSKAHIQRTSPVGSSQT